MPEGLEVEIYRRAAAGVTGRTIESVVIDDHQQMADEIGRVLPGMVVTAVRRHGKLLILRLDSGERGSVELGLHFGMTGRLIVDDAAAIDQLEYASNRDDPAWDRLIIIFSPDSGNGTLRVNDPRRWARFTLEPDCTSLGVDLFEVDIGYLERRLANRRVTIKSALLDQSVIAGLGNLIVDNVLFAAQVAPMRPANSLTTEEIGRIVAVLDEHLSTMLAAGGSHRGVLDPEVRADPPPCFHDACIDNSAPLRRDKVGGRSTIWCERHQR